ncbi:MAG: hypothetical protein PHW63_08635 [Alphaproteobacteria bacterium]|nr:hypothetical protein [Alphaproteobacteria bacterium]
MGCVTQNISYNKEASEKVFTGSPVNDGWFPGERSFPAETKNSVFKSTPYRKGNTPEGYTYTIYPDGSAGLRISENDFLTGWSINCRVDPITDHRNCSLSSSATALFISYSDSNSPEYICIVGHDFPSRKGAIRIDAETAITTDETGCISGKYARKMSEGAMVTTRKYKWPYDYPSDLKGSLAGVKRAMDMVSFIRNNIDKISFDERNSSLDRL